MLLLKSSTTTTTIQSVLRTAATKNSTFFSTFRISARQLCAESNSCCGEIISRSHCQNHFPHGLSSSKRAFFHTNICFRNVNDEEKVATKNESSATAASGASTTPSGSSPTTSLDTSTERNELIQKSGDIFLNSELHAIDEARASFPDFKINNLFDPKRNTRDVVLDFFTYLVPYAERRKYFFSFLSMMAKVHPGAVVTIYDEADYHFKQVYSTLLMATTAMSLSKLGQPEAAIKLMQNAQLPTGHFLLKAHITVLLHNGKFDEAFHLIDSSDCTERVKSYAFMDLIEEMSMMGEGDRVVALMRRHSKGRTFFSSTYMKVIRSLLNHKQLSAAKEVAHMATKTLRLALQRGSITEQQLDDLENQFTKVSDEQKQSEIDKDDQQSVADKDENAKAHST